MSWMMWHQKIKLHVCMTMESWPFAWATNPFTPAVTLWSHNWCGFLFNSAQLPPWRPISSRCLIGDKHPGQCRPHHGRPAFTHHANNCQAWSPSLFYFFNFFFCLVVIDSSPLTRFIGVRTFFSVTSNWSVVPLAAGPGPWLGQPKDKDASDELSTVVPHSSSEVPQFPFSFLFFSFPFFFFSWSASAQ